MDLLSTFQKVAAEKDRLVVLWLVESSTQVTVETVHEVTEEVAVKMETAAVFLLRMASGQH